MPKGAHGLIQKRIMVKNSLRISTLKNIGEPLIFT